MRRKRPRLKDSVRSASMACGSTSDSVNSRARRRRAACSSDGEKMSATKTLYRLSVDDATGWRSPERVRLWPLSAPPRHQVSILDVEHLERQARLP
jgi:hypothetical protein